MGCKGKDRENHCVCDAVEQILAEQEAVEEIACPTSCFSNLLSPAANPGRDTIPFILFDKKGDLFKAFGNVGELNNGSCFKTVFFRVEAVKDCCATLSLLRPVNGSGQTECCIDPCDLVALEKSEFCIEVDLDCFCAIQCLSPDLVGRAISPC
ncbi:CotY/CotZ family spore coat protein [Metabacillus sp. Hm71]|uniref:CotY/CotZ family spore coat protein n=1 Tax=Metabacillus sp. Hm71 TaxID=3450743 RepID=UPI003F43D4BF